MLKNLEIKGLFGFYDYSLDFENDAGHNIKFITGPNGYGKTTVLNLIYALLVQEWNFFVDTVFASLRYGFEDGTILVEKHVQKIVVKGSDLPDTYAVTLKVVYLNENGDEMTVFCREHAETGDKDSYSGEFPKEMNMYLNKKSKYYVRDTRLYEFADENGNATRKLMVVNKNNEDLVTKMKNTSEEIRLAYAKLKLDFDSDYSLKEYEEDTVSLKPFVDKLQYYGLSSEKWPEYDVNFKGKTQMLVEFFKNVKKQVEDFIARLDLFSELVSRCKFSNKKMLLQASIGCVFIPEGGENLPLTVDKLSSGEQHTMIQFYEMLFKTEKGALVLIDEPEMSFHMAWQIHFMRNVEDICKMRNIQCIIATHSPQIFGRKWNLTCDLYRLTHPQIVKEYESRD